jgi:pyruvate/2-oxoglutarate dehydrogenase complex dihydrolipoamide dehydrogenase (E3) component
MTMRWDAVVVGAGQGGVPLAARLAESGRRVLLVERAEPGGTCVNSGCTPTKTLIASAQAAHDARTAGRLGVGVGGVEVDFAAVMGRVHGVVKQWREGVRRRLDRAGETLTLLRGEARFVGPRRIAVGGEEHEGDVVVLNVGCRPVVPPIAGLETVAYLTNESALALTRLPEHLVVIGGGYIGCELGQAFARLGSAVTIVDPGAHLMSREDEDVSAALEAALRGEGVGLRLGTGGVERVWDDGAVCVELRDGRRVEGSHLLVATGRRPNTDTLGCDAAGIALDERGYVVVDDAFRTSAEGVHAIGDCTPGPQFTHSSWDDGRILFDVLIDGRTGGRGGRIVPYTAFTDPQVARVGLSERDARDRGVAYEAASMPFSAIARAIEADVPSGTLKVLVDPETERILGAAIVGAQAGELIHVFAVLMKAGASARAIVDAQMVHPTFAEGLQTLVMKLDRFALKPRPCLPGSGVDPEPMAVEA